MWKIDPPSLSRRAWLVLIAAGVLSLPVGWGAHTSLTNMANDPGQWSPKGHPGRQQVEKYATMFATGEAIIVSWQGCTTDDDRLAKFAKALSVHDQWIDSVVTSREVLDRLTDDPLNFSTKLATERLRGSFVGPDGQTACCVVSLTPQAEKQQAQVIKLIHDTAQRACGITYEAMFLAGPSVTSEGLAQVAKWWFGALFVPSSLLVVLVAWPCLRSLRLTFLVCLGAGFSEFSALALISLMGERMNGMMIVMPALIFVSFVSGAVHLINYYFDAASEGQREDAPLIALRNGVVPCSLAILTTSIGAGALMSSQIPPVQSFGFFTSMGMLMALVILLTLIPGAMVWHSRGVSKRDSQLASQESPTGRRLGRWTQHGQAIVTRWHSLIAAVFLLLMVVCMFGFPRLRPSLTLEDSLSEKSDTLQDCRWLESHLGPVLPLEIAVQFESPEKLTLHEKLVIVRHIQLSLDRSPLVSGTLSAVTFAPPLETGGGVRGTVRRSVLNKLLDKQRETYVDAHYLVEDSQTEVWRISGRVSVLDEIPQAAVYNEVTRITSSALSECGSSSQDMSVVATGPLALGVIAETEMLKDLPISFLLALSVIVVVFIVSMQSVTMGLLSIIPNVFPTVIVFGTLGLLGIAVELSTMMTASIGLGIAVDDTVHFLTWFRRGIAAGLTREQAVQSAYRHCGRAMVRTTLICTFGVVLYVLSTFTMASHFALLVCLLLVAALVGDLVLLPALLLGCWGSWIVRGISSRRSSPTSSTP